MSGLDDYLAGFGEEPGYLDFARFGPLSRAVAAESDAQHDALTRARSGTFERPPPQNPPPPPRARWGTFERLLQNVDRLRAAAAAVTGFRQDQVTLQPSTTEGLTQAVLGVRGGVLLSPADYPSLPTAAVRASDALGAMAPNWLTTDDGRVTPSLVR